VKFSVTILGSSGAVPAFGRYPSSQLVEIQNHFMLVDCGEGAQMQLMRYEANWHRISHIFISHLHGDHYLGLMGLLFTMHLNHRTADLHLYSHKGLDEIITAQLKYSRSALRFKLVFHFLTPHRHEIILDTKHFTVETIPLTHKLDCSGFLFREKQKPRRIKKDELPPGLPVTKLASLKAGADITDEEGNILYKNADLTLPPRRSRTYAYCSDTLYDEGLIAQLKQVDLLYHEATFMEEEKDKAIDTLHTTAAQAARLARQARVGELVIGHFSARYKELSGLLREARAEFKNTTLAIEGETFVIQE
jgi:ribonuclease Z